MDQVVAAMKGVQLVPLKIIDRDLGNIMHALKANEEEFAGFGEAYFTFVNSNAIKGWKKHRQMILNLIVPVGEVKFVLYDDREGSTTKGSFFQVILSRNNYQRLTVSPDLWIAFKGISSGENMILNIGNIIHDPKDTIEMPVEHLTYTEW